MDSQVRRGRPRSESAKRAVLHAVDDLLVEVGYAELSMKGIADRAGVGRQTLYRWWSSKAEILLEASLLDAEQELLTRPRSDAAADLLSYLTALNTFLTTSHAGLAYRALIGEAQHDPEVRSLLQGADPIGASAGPVLARVRPSSPHMPDTELASAQLTGPLLQLVLSHDRAMPMRLLRRHVGTLLTAWGYSSSAVSTPSAKPRA